MSQLRQVFLDHPTAPRAANVSQLARAVRVAVAVSSKQSRQRPAEYCRLGGRE
jgi:hypothetical protein